MSDTYDWPEGLGVSGFSLHLRRNTRTFTSPHSGSSQTVEFGGERWVAQVTLAPTDRRSALSLKRESLGDKLAGGLNRVRLYHFYNPTAGGTFTAAPAPFTWTRSGSPFSWTRSGAAFLWTVGTLALVGTVAAGSGSCFLQSIAGRTVTEGSMLSINGQLVRVLADSSADGSGRIALTFAPRARNAWPAYTSTIVTSYATAPFKLSGEVPTTWSAGLVAGSTFDLIEDIN